MEFLDALRAEHAAIEAVASAFVGYATQDERARDAEDGRRFVRFFRVFAGRYHHGREEDVLFPALVTLTEVPADRGPIAVLRGDHERMSALLDDVAAALGGGDLLVFAKRYASELLHHIDAETSVLFPEAESRFRRVCVATLEARAIDAEELAAQEDGARLAARYGATKYVVPTRGEGCVCCPAFGVACDGVEREWSSDLEWDDMLERIGRN